MEFIENLVRACERVEAKYFLLPVAGRDHPVKRERVYCYELYHQLRKELKGTELTLTGEPDKSGHPDFGPGRQINPDFIFHFPGSRLQNLAAVEVECSVSLKHLKKDIRNLKAMKSQGYGELILLLFAVSDVPWSKLNAAANEVGVDLAQIKVLLHSHPATAALISQPPVGLVLTC